MCCLSVDQEDIGVALHGLWGKMGDVTLKRKFKFKDALIFQLLLYFASVWYGNGGENTQASGELVMKQGQFYFFNGSLESLLKQFYFLETHRGK